MLMGKGRFKTERGNDNRRFGGKETGSGPRTSGGAGTGETTGSGASPRKYDNSGASPRKYDNSGTGPRKYDNSGAGTRKYDNKEATPRRFENKEDGPKRFDNKDGGARRYEGRGTSSPRSEERKHAPSEKALIDRADENENMVEGRNPVIETIKAGRTIEKLYIAKGATEGSIKKIISMAKEKGIVVNEVEKIRLDNMSTTGSHQGVIALVTPYVYFEIDDMLAAAKAKGEDPFIIVLDEIEDPHNLGSIIRSVNVLGAHGVIIPKRRSVGVTATVLKSASGAADHTKIAKVTNLTVTLKELKEKGLWIIGADMGGEPCYKSNLTGPIALVIGSEGNGISKLVKENCDAIVSIPVIGEISSFNASVAAGIAMYEVVRQRINKK